MGTTKSLAGALTNSRAAAERQHYDQLFLDRQLRAGKAFGAGAGLLGFRGGAYPGRGERPDRAIRA